MILRKCGSIAARRRRGPIPMTVRVGDLRFQIRIQRLPEIIGHVQPALALAVALASREDDRSARQERHNRLRSD